MASASVIAGSGNLSEATRMTVFPTASALPINVTAASSGGLSGAKATTTPAGSKVEKLK